MVLTTDKPDPHIRSRAILYGALDCYVKPLGEEAIRLLISLMRQGPEGRLKLSER